MAVARFAIADEPPAAGDSQVLQRATAALRDFYSSWGSVSASGVYRLKYTDMAKELYPAEELFQEDFEVPWTWRESGEKYLYFQEALPSQTGFVAGPVFMSFDGTFRWSLQELRDEDGEVYARRATRIRRRPTQSDLRNYRTSATPALLCGRVLLHSEGSVLDCLMRRNPIYVGTESIDGSPCEHFEVGPYPVGVNNEYSATLSAWLDPEHDYLARRLAFGHIQFPDSEHRIIVRRFTRVRDERFRVDRWFPAEAVVQNPAAEEHVLIETVSFNGRLAADAFQPSLVAGDVIEEQSTLPGSRVREFVVGGGKGALQKLMEERVAAAEKLRYPFDATLAQVDASRKASWNLPLLIFVVSSMVLVGLFLIRRRRRSF